MLPYVYSNSLTLLTVLWIKKLGAKEVGFHVRKKRLKSSFGAAKKRKNHLVHFDFHGCKRCAGVDQNTNIAFRPAFQTKVQ